MPVEFIKQLHQSSLEKAWNARPAKAPKDPMPKRRQNVLSRIDAALAQLKSGETNPPRGNYQTRDNFNGVRVQLKYGQRALVIDGRDHWFVEDAATFFSNAREAVGRGELDGAIIDALEGKDKGKNKDKGTRPAPESKSPDLGKVYNLNFAPDGKASADQLHAAKPGKFAQKYEKLLAAGIFSEPAL
jgi:hypothetical protein